MMSARLHSHNGRPHPFAHDGIVAGDCPINQELGRVVAGGDGQATASERAERIGSSSEAISIVEMVIQEDVGGLIESQLVARDTGMA